MKHSTTQERAAPDPVREGPSPDPARAILDRLAARASCRDFDGSAIDRSILQEIVADGIEAPSSCNQQNWHFIVVTDAARKAMACEIAGGNPHFETCGALIYLCFQKGWTHGNFSIVQSVAGACYHMMLSAHLRGFRCIWNAGIGDHDRLRALLALPPVFEVQGALAIGRPRASAPAMKAPRRAAADVMSWEVFERPAASIYPARPADAYPFFAIRNDDNPFAEWNPERWSWEQIADFRGLSVWAKSPLAGVHVSRRQSCAQAVEHGLLPDLSPGATVVEAMGWGGTSTAALLRRLPDDADLHVAELSPHNLSFIRERLRQEGLTAGRVGYDLMPRGRLPQADGSVDLIVLPQVLEHVPDRAAVLKECARALRPGGHLVVSARNMASAYGAEWRQVESRAQVPNQGPFTPLDAAALRAELTRAFTLEEECGIGRAASGDAARLDGADILNGRLYAARLRRD